MTNPDQIDGIMLHWDEACQVADGLTKYAEMICRAVDRGQYRPGDADNAKGYAHRMAAFADILRSRMIVGDASIN